MRQHSATVSIATKGSGLCEFTRDLNRFVAGSGIDRGLTTAFCRHTSASLLVQENADDDVKTDLMYFFRRLVPERMDQVVHRAEGHDDMPAHMKAALTRGNRQSAVGSRAFSARGQLRAGEKLTAFPGRPPPTADCRLPTAGFLGEP
jgi:secondary thiamine-phosphate synthase enzyme